MRDEKEKTKYLSENTVRGKMLFRGEARAIFSVVMSDNFIFMTF